MDIIQIKNLTNTSGAGDTFASGFLHGYINKMGIDRSVFLGILMASAVLYDPSARVTERNLLKIFLDVYSRKII